MGVNLHGIAQGLGLVGPSHMAPTDPSLQTLPTTTGPNPSALLGAQTQSPAGDPNAPASESNPSGVITATGSKPLPMTPQDMGMPSFPNSAPANPDDIRQQRQNMLNSQDMARQLYHPGSEFGAHGILRDIVGNAEDFGRRLLGFAPRYNQEKLSEREYGMTATNPDGTPNVPVQQAATEAAMEYNAPQAAAYEQHLNAQRAQMISSQATAEYKNAQAAARSANILGGLGQRLRMQELQIDPNDPQRTQKLQAIWDGVKPTINKLQTDIYGKGNEPSVPDQYDSGYVNGMTSAGMTGSNITQQQDTLLRTQAQRDIAQGHNLTWMQVAQLGYDGRKYMADTAYRAAVHGQLMRYNEVMAPQTITEDTTPTGTILKPGKTQTRTVTRGGGGAPAPAPAPAAAPAQGGPPVGYRSKAGFTFHGGDPRNAANWSK